MLTKCFGWKRKSAVEDVLKAFKSLIEEQEKDYHKLRGLSNFEIDEFGNVKRIVEVAKDQGQGSNDVKD